MKKYGIFYGSTTGTTRDVAQRIARLMGIDTVDVHDVASTAPSAVGDYETLILGTSTWGSGELQDDWQDFINGLRVMDLKEKKTALFGCGDESMADTFCDGVAKIYDALQETGTTFIGAFPADVYCFEHSDAVKDGIAVGLLLDEANHDDLTDGRIQAWVDELKKES